MLPRYPGESVELCDRRTHRRVVQLTSAPCINHHLYFLTPSLGPGEEEVFFCSYRGPEGTPQLYAAGFPAGEIRCLTGEAGLNGFSATLSADGRELYFTTHTPEGIGRIRALPVNDPAAVRTVAEYTGAQLGECSLSHDGTWVVTALRDEAGFGLAVARTDGSAATVPLRVPRTVIHPQFHPSSAEWILYARDPAPRMWWARRDGSVDECLYRHENDEFLVHETFLGRAGEFLIVTRWPSALRRYDLRRRCFVADIAAVNAWHLAADAAGRRVLCDTVHPDRGLLLIDVDTGQWETLCYPEASCGGSQWRSNRYALPEDFAVARQAAERDGALSWMEMKADTVYGPQWTHPHPSFSPSERWVVFTSDRTGHPQVYAVRV
jgi:oligogalacturonide lyase